MCATHEAEQKTSNQTNKQQKLPVDFTRSLNLPPGLTIDTVAGPAPATDTGPGVVGRWPATETASTRNTPFNI